MAFLIPFNSMVGISEVNSLPHSARMTTPNFISNSPAFFNDMLLLNTVVRLALMNSKHIGLINCMFQAQYAQQLRRKCYVVMFCGGKRLIRETTLASANTCQTNGECYATRGLTNPPKKKRLRRAYASGGPAGQHSRRAKRPKAVCWPLCFAPNGRTVI